MIYNLIYLIPFIFPIRTDSCKSSCPCVSASVCMCVGEAATSTLLVILEDRTVTFNKRLQSPHLKYHVIQESINEQMRPSNSSRTAHTLKHTGTHIWLCVSLRQCHICPTTDLHMIRDKSVLGRTSTHTHAHDHGYR